MAKDSTTKQVLSTKVTASLKYKLVEQAKKEGITTSEYVAKILASDWEKQENKYKSEIEDLTFQIKEKDKLLESLSESLKQEQNLLGQQQQLQLMAQQQINDMQKNQQLLIETTSKKKWWQIFK